MAIEYPLNQPNKEQALQMLKERDPKLTLEQHLQKALGDFLFSTANFVENKPGEDKPIVRRAKESEIQLARLMVAAALDRMKYAAIALVANGATTNGTLNSLLHETNHTPSQAIYSPNTIQLNLASLTEGAKTILTQVVQTCIREKDMVVTFGKYPPIMAEGFGGIGIPMLGYTQVDHYNSPLLPPYQAGELFIASPVYGDLTPAFSRLLGQLPKGVTPQFPSQLRNQLSLELCGGIVQSFSTARLTIQRLPETNTK